ncbi:MAG: hypothetical protein ABIN94_07790 [Ferruginibacter sp.]
MKMFTGRVTASSNVNAPNFRRLVGDFSAAPNHYYKPKNSEEGKIIAADIKWACWVNARSAECLTKRAVVEVAGRLFTTGYISGKDPKASLNCGVSNFKVHHSPKKEAPAGSTETAAITKDLSF